MTTQAQYVTKDLGFNAIQAALKVLNKGHVMVGLPGDSPQAVDHNHKPIPGMTVAGVGIINEFGSIPNGIPSRPFMRQTYQLHGKTTLALAKVLYQKVSSLKLTPVKALTTLGVYYEGKVKDTIVNGNFVPNSDATVARKGSSRPLVDTGLMRASITSRVVI